MTASPTGMTGSSTAAISASDENELVANVSSKLNPGNPEAARAVWPELSQSETKLPSIVRRAAMRAMVLFTVSAIIYFVLAWHRVAELSAFLAALTLYLGRFWPSTYLQVENFLDRSSHWVGVALSWLLLGPFYFLVLTPLAWATKKERRERMGLSFKKGAGTNWKKRVSSATHLDRPY